MSKVRRCVLAVASMMLLGALFIVPCAQAAETQSGTDGGSLDVKITSQSEDPKTNGGTEPLGETRVSPGPTIESGAVYTISSALDPSKSLDVKAASTENEAKVQIYDDNQSPAQRWRITELGDSTYEIVSVGSGKALDVPSAKAAQGVTIQQYQANKSDAQKWIASVDEKGYFTFASALDTLMVLDVASGSSANGTRVQLWTSNGSDAQKWILNRIYETLPTDVYTIQNIGSSKDLDIASASYSNSANLQQYRSNGTFAQKFKVAFDDRTGYYSIINVNSAKVLDAAGGGTSKGTNVQQYAANGTAAQQWIIDYSKDGYVIRSAKSGLVLDVSAGSKADGANVQLWEYNSTAAQQWKFVPISDFALPEGAYTIVSLINTNNVVDISGGSFAEKANIQVYSSNNTNAQRWEIKKDGSSRAYTIRNAASGKYLTAVSSASGSNVQTSSTSQSWIISFENNGFVISLQGNPGIVLDVAAASTRSGANLQVYASNDTTAQRFTFRATEALEPSTTYQNLSITLSQMAKWQNGEHPDISVSTYEAALDPANGSKTQFLDLRGYTGLTAAQLNAFISSTALAGMGEYFVTAAKSANINEAYLLAHSILETGWGSSKLAQGYSYGGKTYYNYFGYGAVDTDPINAGRSTAVKNDWSSREKAIVGAASLIAKGYVYAESYAQPTIYAMKWDYSRSDAEKKVGWHQYATGTEFAKDIAKLVDQIYSAVGASGNNLKYIIPVYKS